MIERGLGLASAATVRYTQVSFEQGLTMKQQKHTVGMVRRVCG